MTCCAFTPCACCSAAPLVMMYMSLRPYQPITVSIDNDVFLLSALL